MAIFLYFSESVDTKISSKTLLFKASLIVYQIKGLPLIFAMFLFLTVFDPLRAKN